MSYGWSKDAEAVARRQPDDESETQTAMLLTQREWEILASICWGWKRHTDAGQQAALPHYGALCDRIIAAVESD